MAQAPTVGALLVDTVPLKLAVNEGEPNEIALELKLAWTMRAILLMESKLREFGIYGINVLQDPSSFWDRMDCSLLAIAVWALAQQEHSKEYGGNKGFDTIASFLVTETYPAAVKAIKAAFLSSLSDKRRREIEDAETKEKEQKHRPTPAPSQT